MPAGIDAPSFAALPAAFWGGLSNEVRLGSAVASGPADPGMVSGTFGWKSAFQEIVMYSTRRVILCALTAAFLSASLNAQSVLPRTDHGARLEPRGRIMNGAGQSADAFQNYWNAMAPDNKPVVSMYYVNLRGVQRHWSREINAQLLELEPQFVIPQIGLSMTVDGSPGQHYEGDVAAGLLDGDIAAFLDGLVELARPVYLRIGYEFNGLSWNGYQPQTYQSAFRRITDKIRERNLEVATVWDCEIDGTANFMDFYPGDTYVDWFGINLFSDSHLTHPNTYAFLDLAVSHNKPVMIGESTPRYVGVLDGLTSWTTWFLPYFNLIHSRPEIKMFCYINWDWSRYPPLADWGDCRLEMNDYVKQQFTQEMNSAAYLHARTETAFRQLLSYGDTDPPPPVSQLNASPGTCPEYLQWNPTTDNSGLAHYLIYKNGSLAGYSLNPEFEDFTIKAGEQNAYYVTAMDRAGNESPASTSILVEVADPIDRILNGEWNSGTDNWSLGIFSTSASATLSADAASRVSGANSAHVAVSRSSGTGWHIQLRQPVLIRRGMAYNISYQARAGQPANISAVIQSDHSPFDIYVTGAAALTTQVQTFAASFVAAKDDAAYLEFFLGGIGQTDVWIDAVSVVETPSSVLPFSFVNQGGVSDITAGYSGPVQTGYARIQPTGGNTTPAGVAIFGFRQGGVLVTEAGVLAAPLVRAGRVFGEIGGGINTGLALANPNNQAAAISYYFTNSDGDNFGAGSTLVAASSQTAVFLDQAPYNGGSSVLGTFTFSSTLPVSVVALRGLYNERNEFLLTTLPIAELSSATGERVITHFADGGGWATQVVLVNPTEEPMSGVVSFFSPGSPTTPGLPLVLTVNGQTGGSFPYSIPPGSARRFLTSGAGAATQSGYIRIIPSFDNKTPTGLGIFSFKVGGFTIAQAGVPASPAGAAFRLYVESAGVFGTLGSIQSGIAVANLSSDPVIAACELTRLDGSSTGLSANVPIPASGQVALFLNQIQGFGGLPATFKGVLRISTPSNAAISVIGLRSRVNERGDFLITTTPSLDEDSSANTAESVFPQLADSGGYTTQFILISGIRGQASSGVLRFLSQSGQPLPLPFR